ncbi:MAG: hypothetical protein ACREEE_18750 [Dongiaceae bacterium]
MPAKPPTAFARCGHYLGAEVNLRQRLAECGRLPLNSPEIGEYARHCISNELAEGDAAFTPRA